MLMCEVRQRSHSGATGFVPLLPTAGNTIKRMLVTVHLPEHELKEVLSVFLYAVLRPRDTRPESAHILTVLSRSYKWRECDIDLKRRG
jgi:predicted nucleic acid-binding protein